VINFNLYRMHQLIDPFSCLAGDGTGAVTVFHHVCKRAFNLVFLVENEQLLFLGQVEPGKYPLNRVNPLLKVG